MEEKKWKVLASEYLFKDDWLTVRKEKLELPNGNIVPSYYVLEYPDWVNIIAITKEQQFIFIRQYRHGLGRYDFEIVGGVCDKEDADTLVSAKRELMEETGYGNGNWEKLMEVSSNPGTCTNMVHCYLATDLEKISEQNLDESEDISVHLLSLEEVKDLLFSGGIKQSLMLAPLWRYMAINKLI